MRKRGLVRSTRRRLAVALLALACGASAAPARAAVAAAAAVSAPVEASIEAPNVVPISAMLVTSGQPSAAALGRLGAQGFGAVIYLAPLTSSDAVAGEADIVRRQGLQFVNIPIEFGEPTDADVQAFVAAMKRLGDRKVLVHCQVNMRASTMTFLYRVMVLREQPEPAYEAVARIWSPRGPWKKLLVAQLQQAGIAFEPY
ncbi:MAG: protein tyrosine phosphatase family protein [Pseudomonadota bacterium]|nr:protein tyrosine phosphatase family protein [Pseudomonadota bacterium]